MSDLFEKVAPNWLKLAINIGYSLVCLMDSDCCACGNSNCEFSNEHEYVCSVNEQRACEMVEKYYLADMDCAPVEGKIRFCMLSKDVYGRMREYRNFDPRFSEKEHQIIVHGMSMRKIYASVTLFVDTRTAAAIYMCKHPEAAFKAAGYNYSDYPIKRGPVLHGTTYRTPFQMKKRWFKQLLNGNSNDTSMDLLEVNQILYPTFDCPAITQRPKCGTLKPIDWMDDEGCGLDVARKDVYVIEAIGKLYIKK